MKIPNSSIPPVRVRNQELSLWQSVVAAYAIKEFQEQTEHSTALNLTQVQEHPMVQGTNHLARQCEHHNRLDSPELQKALQSDPSEEAIIAWYSYQFFQIARQDQSQLDNPFSTLCEKWKNDHRIRRYSNRDYCGWAWCVKQYEKTGVEHGYRKKYNAFADNGGLNFGLIDYKLPNDAKVAIIGDWGTGMSDAYYLLDFILKNHQPDAVIHLGDIYYAGSASECNNNFSAIFDHLFTKYPRVPVFTIPGNHDYYSYGYAYYDMVRNLNTGIKGATQEASYFCLRTADGGWQFLGMDTGYDDSDPNYMFNPDKDGPTLKHNELAWHQDKLDHFEGKTILLSHHQLFSGNAKINGENGLFGSYPYLNKYLLDNFRPYFKDKIAAWFWGHEHNQVRYDAGLFGLKKGRLIGASAYEEAQDDQPYASTYPTVPFLNFDPYKLKKEHGYYNHGYAIIDLSQRADPTDPVRASYYQYPSWGKDAPVPIPQHSEAMWSEIIGLNHLTPIRLKIQYGQDIHLNLEQGQAFIGKMKKHKDEYAPTIQTSPTKLQILSASGKTGTIRDGDIVHIKTLENLPDDSYRYLGAWDTVKFLYYYEKGYGKRQNWKIKKVSGTAFSEISENEAIHLINQDNTGQYLCPYLPLDQSTTYLTTHDAILSCWFIQLPIGDAITLARKGSVQLGLNFDENLFDQISRYLAPSSKNVDAALVACSDPAELARIKNNFLIGKLGLKDHPRLHEAILKVCDITGKSNNKKYRTAFYYLLTVLFEKASQFD